MNPVDPLAFNRERVPGSLNPTAPARPAIRIFMPLRSLTLLISLRNQPPICVPVLPLGIEMRFDLAKNSSISLVPVP